MKGLHGLFREQNNETGTLADTWLTALKQSLPSPQHPLRPAPLLDSQRSDANIVGTTRAIASTLCIERHASKASTAPKNASAAVATCAAKCSSDSSAFSFWQPPA
jgi:hypothetical protein